MNKAVDHEIVSLRAECLGRISLVREKLDIIQRRVESDTGTVNPLGELQSVTTILDCQLATCWSLLMPKQPFCEVWIKEGGNAPWRSVCVKFRVGNQSFELQPAFHEGEHPFEDAIQHARRRQRMLAKALRTLNGRGPHNDVVVRVKIR